MFTPLKCKSWFLNHVIYLRNWDKRIVNFSIWLHCKYLNARSECNDIVISVYSHYPLDPNAKSSDTKCVTLSIRWFCIRIERVMTVYGNYDVIAFRSCIQIFTVHYWKPWNNKEYILLILKKVIFTVSSNGQNITYRVVRQWQKPSEAYGSLQKPTAEASCWN